MEEVKISIIICSRNRAPQLTKCLQALPKEDIQKYNAELILVDSASEDDTLQVMEDFKRSSDFPIKVVGVEEKGLGLARNYGVNNSSGDILIFSDDDCYFGDEYIPNVCNNLDNSDCKYCGGQILLYDKNDSFYGCREFSKVEKIPPRSFLWTGIIQGANMVIRRDLFDAIGLFDPELGAGKKFRFEDIDLVARASMAGYWGANFPNMIVYHHHGRKPGEDINALSKENDYARGAYYSKMLLNKHGIYLRKWIARSIRSKDLFAAFREIAGALSYAISQMRKPSREVVN